MKAQIRANGTLSDKFEITNGVKQGCVLAPLLFSIYLAAMLDEAFSGCGNMGVLLQTRIGANLFNVKQFAAKTKTSLNVARELMYADDCAIVAYDHATMQQVPPSRIQLWPPTESKENSLLVPTLTRLQRTSTHLRQWNRP